MGAMKEKKRIYRISFLNQGQVYEVYAKHVAQGGLLGFVEVEDLVFGETTQLVVDPGEERLRNEFQGVKRFYVPLQAVIRIDEVDQRGPSRISEPAKGGSLSFPVPMFPGGADTRKS